jgi:predicted permease
MRWTYKLSLRFRSLFRRSSVEQELSEELRFHLDGLIEQNVSKGIALKEARYAALRELGGIEQIKEECRDRWGVRFVNELGQDIRYGLRQLRRNPSFAVVAVLTLALGIAANTTIFSVVSLVLMKKPAVHNPANVVIVASNNREKGWDLLRVSVPNFKSFRRQNDVFKAMAAAADSDFTLTGSGSPAHLDGALVTANYFHVLGLAPFIGRAFAANEDEAGHNHVVILNYGLWRQHFAADRNVIGKEVDINGEPYTVIGVMPPGTDLALMQPQLWTPIVFSAKNLSRNSRFLLVFARLKHGVTSAKARAEMAAIAARIAQRHPDTEKGWSSSVLPMQQYMIQAADVRPSLVVLMSTVGFVLLIACANIAGLLLARAEGRQQEIAIRASLGAGRLRVVRQLLVESLLIALAGGGLGVILGRWGINFLRAAIHWNFSNAYMAYLARNFHLDGRTVFFTAVLTLGATLLFGLVPALQASKPNLIGTLKEGGRTGTAGISRSRLRRVLVTGEIALGVVLLAGAGLFTQDFIQEITQNPGFNPRHVITARIILSSKQYQNEPARQAAFYDRVVSNIRNLPGVKEASATQWLPLEGGWQRSVKVEGHRSHLTGVYLVGASYFRTLQIPLMRGREFSSMDNGRAPKVAIVSESFARKYFPEGNAIGQRIFAYTYHPAWAEIVGIVRDVKEFPGQIENDPQVYVPYLQQPAANMEVVVRMRYAASEFAPLLRRAVWSVDKEQPLEDVMTMRQVEDEGGMGGDRLVTGLMSVFAGLALILSAVGIYGVIAYSVAQRTHEIGVRMAMGAQKTDVLRLVLKQGGLIATIGSAIGLVLALPLPKLFGAMFDGFTGSPLVVIAVGTAVAIVSLLATYIPARRATKIEPVVALRYE